MNELFQEEESQSTRHRYQGYDRIMGNISWLLILLVILDMKINPAAVSNTGLLSGASILLFFYNINARYGFYSHSYGTLKIFADLIVFLAFIVAVSWHTGKISSPFIALLYLVLLATALTQGRRVTYFMAGLAIAAYFLLASAVSRETGYYLSHLVELFPFLLIAHMGTLLTGENEEARREVERLSLTDDLTGINNMRNFFLLADNQERLAHRFKRPFAICMLDADNLKKVNDRYGHFAGTRLIQQVAEMVTANVRGSDVAARYGGDEFVILFTETCKDDAQTAVERIVGGMAARPFDFEGESILTTLSAGLAGYPEDGADVRSVMAHADEAMYISKRSGKNRLTLYSESMYSDTFGKHTGVIQ